MNHDDSGSAPKSPNVPQTPPVPIVGGRLWHMCNDMAWFPYVQARAQTTAGRQSVMEQYGIPVGDESNPTVGYWMINYENGLSNDVVVAWVREALATLIGPSDYQGEAPNAAGDKLEPTNLFGFLYQLSQNAELWAQYRNDATRAALLEQFFGTLQFPNVQEPQTFDHYGEMEALETLAKTGDADPLKDSLARISATYQTFVGWS
ncbi:MAG: hypothetical protein KDK70_01585 [Myxococcales bacterium]|nr:hypothetical protein [Myxococcales bacterium]